MNNNNENNEVNEPVVKAEEEPKKVVRHPKDILAKDLKNREEVLEVRAERRKAKSQRKGERSKLFLKIFLVNRRVCALSLPSRSFS